MAEKKTTATKKSKTTKTSEAKITKKATSTKTKKVTSKKTAEETKTASVKKTWPKKYTWWSYKGTAAKFDPNGKTLVIVESPGKVKTISKYLWSDYVIKPSVGHIVDLVDKNMNKLVEKEFEPDYEVDPDKSKVVSELKYAIKSSSKVILATDEDREGEAIAYHLTQVLGLDPKTTPRIVFNEITKPAILAAIDKPRTLDINLIQAQKSRAVLDKLVWFSVSPVLWSKIKMGLSAGRVQSVAVKLVVEKEREIQAFKAVEYFSLKALLDTNKGPVAIELRKVAGAKEEEIEDGDIKVEKGENGKEAKDQEKQKGWRFSKATLEMVLKQLGLSNPKIEKDEKTGFETWTFKESIHFQLADITTKQSKKSPPAPFITSSLQQTASRMFGRSVKQVMGAAQKLYEAWLITYMRTDSTMLSQGAIDGCKEYIIWHFGEKYSSVRQYKSKSKNAQEAHEAIRPTTISSTPESVSAGQYEQKLYDLIWKRTVASQMSEAIFTNTNYTFYPVV